MDDNKIIILLPVVLREVWKSKKNFEFVKSRVNSWSM